MRAVRLHEYGDVDQLRFEDVPVPAPGSGEAQVRIAASTVNPIDWRMRSGTVQDDCRSNFLSHWAANSRAS